jgi:hypothetical protein
MWSSVDGHTVTAELAPTPEVEQAHDDMQQIAQTVLPLLKQLESQGMSSIARQTLVSITDTDGVPDVVPTWLRKEFCKSVKRSWSDHLPISVAITMPTTA